MWDMACRGMTSELSWIRLVVNRVWSMVRRGVMTTDLHDENLNDEIDRLRALNAKLLKALEIIAWRRLADFNFMSNVDIARAVVTEVKGQIRDKAPDTE